MDCRFCELVNSPHAIRVGSIFCIPDGYPVTEGHALVIPVRHTEDFFSLTPEELRDTRECLGILRDRWTAVGVTDFNIGWNCGVAAGQTVGHAHCHFIPRRAGDQVDPAGGVRGVIPERQKYSVRRLARAEQEAAIVG